MPKPRSQLAKSLADRYRALESTRRKIEDLGSNGRIGKRDIERTYEGLFLSLNVAFEGFLEDVFLGILIDTGGGISTANGVVPRLVIRSHRVAWDVILGISRRKYFDWLPYDRTEELARIFFRGGRPFCELSEAQRQHVFKCQVIRNAIAHKSRYSVLKFEKDILGNSNLPVGERNPAGFLRGNFRMYPAQTRFENYAARLLDVARFLAK